MHLELRLPSDYEGPCNFTAGISYAEDNLNYNNYAAVGLSWFFGPGQDWLHYDYTGAASAQNRVSIAAYIDFTYEINEQWRVSAPVRETQDDKQSVRQQCSNGVNAH